MAEPGLTPAAAPADRLVALTLLLATIGYEVFAPLIQILSPEGSLPAIVLRVTVIAISVVAALQHRHVWGPVRWRALPMFVFLAFYTLRLFDNFFIQGYVWQAEPVLSFSFLLGASILPGYCLHRLADSMQDTALVRAGVAGAVLFLVGLALGFDQLIASMILTRISLDKLNPISIGSVAVSSMLLLLLASPRGRAQAWGRGILMSLFTVVLIFSQARGQIIALALSLVLLSFGSSGAEIRRLMLLIALSLVPLVAVALLADINLLEIFLDRFQTVDTDESAQGRQDAWAASWLQFQDHPWLGDKIFEPTQMHYPHNFVLESMLSLGVPGALLMVAHLLLVLRSAVLLMRSDRATVAHRYVALIAVKEMIAAMFSGAIWSDNLFWTSSACLLGMSLPHEWAARTRRAPAPAGAPATARPQ